MSYDDNKLWHDISAVTRSRAQIPSRDVNIQVDDVTQDENYVDVNVDADVDEFYDYDNGDSFINPGNVENALKFNVSDTVSLMDEQMNDAALK